MREVFEESCRGQSPGCSGSDPIGSSLTRHRLTTRPTRGGVQDLLSDLMHLCERNDWDFTELLRVATENFNAELIDPECNGQEQSDQKGDNQ